jgi:hypothetical protein
MATRGTLPGVDGQEASGASSSSGSSSSDKSDSSGFTSSASFLEGDDHDVPSNPGQLAPAVRFSSDTALRAKAIQLSERGRKASRRIGPYYEAVFFARECSVSRGQRRTFDILTTGKRFTFGAMISSASGAAVAVEVGLYHEASWRHLSGSGELFDGDDRVDLPPAQARQLSAALKRRARGCA